jgi:DNA replication protein DnaC
MTRHKKELMECARMLKLGNLTEHLEELLHQAQEKQLTYPEFLLACLREEVRTRENRKYLCRLKAAGLPARHDLDRYDFTRTEGIDSRKLRELRELVWVGQAYNLLLAGGSGTGKTYIAAGLVHEAVKAGYRAYMVTLEDLLTCLKTRDVSRHAMKTYKRIMKAQLLAIDNATLFPLKREDIMLLFKLVNEFQEKNRLSLQPTTPLQSGWQYRERKLSQRHCLTDCSTVVRLYNCQETAIGWKTGKQFLAIGVKIQTL